MHLHVCLCLSIMSRAPERRSASNTQASVPKGGCVPSLLCIHAQVNPVFDFEAESHFGVTEPCQRDHNCKDKSDDDENGV